MVSTMIGIKIVFESIYILLIQKKNLYNNNFDFLCLQYYQKRICYNVTIFQYIEKYLNIYKIRNEY